MSTNEQYEEPSKHIASIGNHEKGMKNVFCASKNHIPREKMSKFSHLLTVSLTVKYSVFFRLLLHFSEFLILHSIFQDNLTERTIVLWTTFLISIACLVSILHRSAGGKKVNMIISYHIMIWTAADYVEAEHSLGRRQT